MNFKKIKFSAINDEIEETIEDQVKLLKQLNIEFIELRKINNKYLHELTPNEVKTIFDILSQNKMTVSVLDSPLGKKDFSKERFWKIFNIYLVLSQQFKSKYIRIFPINDNLENNIKIMQKMSNIAKEHDVILLVENEKNTLTEKADVMLDLLNKVNEENVQMLFDVENFYFCEEDMIKSYEMLKKFVKCIHLRDFDKDKNLYTVIGNGTLDIDYFMNLILDNIDLNNLFVSFETHLPMNNFEKSKRELFIENVKNCRKFRWYE